MPLSEAWRKHVPSPTGSAKSSTSAGRPREPTLGKKLGGRT